MFRALIDKYIAPYLFYAKVALIASGIGLTFYAGYHTKSVIVEARQAKELAKLQSEKDKLQLDYDNKSSEYEKLASDLRIANDNLQETARHETSKDPICSDRNIPTDKLQLRIKASTSIVNSR